MFVPSGPTTIHPDLVTKCPVLLHSSEKTGNPEEKEGQRRSSQAMKHSSYIKEKMLIVGETQYTPRKRYTVKIHRDSSFTCHISED